MIKQSTNQKTPGAQNVASSVEDKKEEGMIMSGEKKEAEKEVEEERTGAAEETRGAAGSKRGRGRKR